MVIEYSIGYNRQLLQIAGVANTFFVGSAFAYFGKIGSIFSPFIVFGNFYLVTRLFEKLPRNFYTIFIFAYLLYRLTNSISSDIGYFIFSGIQIMIIFLIIIKFIPIITIYKNR